MNWWEILALAYLLWGGARGLWRGPANEVHSLIGALFALAFFAGFNLSAELRAVLTRITGLEGDNASLLGTLTVFITSALLIRIFRNGMHDWVDAHWGRGTAAFWGVLGGTLRNLVVIVLIMLLTGHEPLAYLESLQGRPVATADAE